MDGVRALPFKQIIKMNRIRRAGPRNADEAMACRSTIEGLLDHGTTALVGKANENVVGNKVGLAIAKPAHLWTNRDLHAWSSGRLRGGNEIASYRAYLAFSWRHLPTASDEGRGEEQNEQTNNAPT